VLFSKIFAILQSLCILAITFHSIRIAIQTQMSSQGRLDQAMILNPEEVVKEEATKEEVVKEEATKEEATKEEAVTLHGMNWPQFMPDRMAWYGGYYDDDDDDDDDDYLDDDNDDDLKTTIRDGPHQDWLKQRRTFSPDEVKEAQEVEERFMLEAKKAAAKKVAEEEAAAVAEEKEAEAMKGMNLDQFMAAARRRASKTRKEIREPELEEEDGSPAKYPADTDSLSLASALSQLWPTPKPPTPKPPTRPTLDQSKSVDFPCWSCKIGMPQGFCTNPNCFVGILNKKTGE